MSKTRHAVLIGLAGATLAAVLAPTEAPAQPSASCNSPASCGAFLNCWTGWELVGNIANGASVACKKADPSRVPTCNARNLRGDWVFVRASKECCRGSGNDRTCSKANIDCPGGFAYQDSSGMCEDSAVQWTQITRSNQRTDGSWWTDPTTLRTGTYTEAKRTISCPAGYDLSGGSPTNKRYYCEKPAEGGTQTVPLCDGAGFRFDASVKQCCGQTSMTSPRTCSAEHIRCPEGATYYSFKGMCVKANEAAYAAVSVR